jgi:hypothetical protein
MGILQVGFIGQYLLLSLAFRLLTMLNFLKPQPEQLQVKDNELVVSGQKFWRDALRRL